MTLALLLLALCAPAGDNPTLFVTANAAYERGDFDRAALMYTELVERGADSGWIFYNLGNARLREGQLGLAVAAYLRAQARLPREGDVLQNLKFAREQGKDALAPIAAWPLLRALFFWHFGLTRRELLGAAAAVNLVTFGLAAARRLRPDNEPLAWAGRLAAVVLVALAASYAWHVALPVRLAVVVQPEVAVHSGTSAETVVRFRLHEGSEARLVDGRDGWLRIELADGKQGWVSVDDVARVEL